MTIVLERLSFNSMDDSTNVESSLLASTSVFPNWRNGSTSFCLPEALDTSFLQRVLESWIMKRPDENMLLERSLDFSIRRMFGDVGVDTTRKISMALSKVFGDSFCSTLRLPTYLRFHHLLPCSRFQLLSPTLVLEYQVMSVDPCSPSFH